MSEKLINHVGIAQLDGAYYTPSTEKMFEAYKKAIPNLTIDTTERDRIALEEKDKKINELKKKENEIEKLKTQFKHLENHVHEETLARLEEQKRRYS